EALFSGLKGKNVGLGKIDDMNVIPDAGAVRRWVIGSVNLTSLRLTQRDFEHVGNQVRFYAVMLTELHGGSCRIEITKGNKLQPVDLLVPAQHALEDKFRFPVRIDRS